MSRFSKTMVLVFVALIAVGLFFANKYDFEAMEAAPIPSPAPLGDEKALAAPEGTPEAPKAPKGTAAPVKAGEFELPIRGATGYATVEMNLRSEADPNSKLIRKVEPATAFRILGEQGEYWRVENDDFSGWLAHKYCMINLPDVIPSMIYENTNASKSRVVSSGKDVPGITGQQLYKSQGYNERLGREEFIMPTMYSMAKKICQAQQSALAEGNSLKVYEAYRPYSAQRTMVDALKALATSDSEVKQGITAAPWKASWFIALGTSNHQRGCAIDASLVKVKATEQRWVGDYPYNAVTDFTEYNMPSPIHELSIASVAFDAPVLSTSTTAWKEAAPSKAMNQAALSMQRYCADAGLTPLASEWWHFNDLESLESLGSNAGQGRNTLTELFSVEPSAAS